MCSSLQSCFGEYKSRDGEFNSLREVYNILSFRDWQMMANPRPYGGVHCTYVSTLMFMVPLLFGGTMVGKLADVELEILSFREALSMIVVM